MFRNFQERCHGGDHTKSEVTVTSDEEACLDFGPVQVTQYIYTFLFTTELILRVWDAFWTVPNLPVGYAFSCFLPFLARGASKNTILSMAG